MDRNGLRLKLFKQQAMAGDIVLLFGDESEVLTHPYLAHARAKRGADLRVPAPGQLRKPALLGVIDHVTAELTAHTSATKRSTRLHRSARTHRSPLWSPSGAGRRPGRSGPRQRPDPCQQTDARRASQAALAHYRVVAEVRPGTQRHRTPVARPETPLPRPSNLPLRRGLAGRRRRCDPKTPPGTHYPSVSGSTNRCLASA